MGWTLSGELIESCSCNVLCPCWFGVQDLMEMDQGWCDSTFLFCASEGSSNGVELGGTTVVVAMAFPGPTLFDGEGTARLHIDDGASEEQRRELESIFQGKRGGPMEILGGLTSTWLPTDYCDIHVQDDGKKLTAEVGDVGVVSSEVLENEAGTAMTMRDAGLAAALNFDGAAFKVAPSGTRWSDPDMPRPIKTKSGARATWQWAVS